MEVLHSDRKSKWQQIRYSIGIGAFVVFILFCCGTAVALHRATIIVAWIPVYVSFVVAALLSIKLRYVWRRLIRTDGFLMSYLVSTAVLTSIITALLYTANFLWVDSSSGHTEQVTVVHRYAETRYRTKRVGRRYVRQGEPYKVYYIELVLLNDTHKRLPVTRDQFNRIREGTQIPLYVENGLFDVPVIKGGSKADLTMLNRSDCKLE